MLDLGRYSWPRQHILYRGGEAFAVEQVEIARAVAADFAKHRYVAGDHRDAAHGGFHQRQAKAFRDRPPHGAARIGVEQLQIRVVGVVEPQQAAAELRGVAAGAVRSARVFQPGRPTIT